ncbi:MAG: hypothetical protein LBR81_10075 [Prevotellaceae bacterium]|jgi:hypothetical protein|nr:hypothetical protein [Prevotellaceae bacterium]
MKKLFVIILLFISFCPIKGSDIQFINVSKTLDSLERGELLVENIKFNLPSCIYLDCSLKKRIDNIDSSYLKKNIGYYFCGQKGEIYLIKLNSNYKNIEDLVKYSDTTLFSFLDEKFGFRFRDLELPILRYKNKILLGFSYSYGSGSVIVALINSKTVKIELVVINEDHPAIEEIIPAPEDLPSVDTTIWNKDGTRK